MSNEDLLLISPEIQMLTHNSIQVLPALNCCGSKQLILKILDFKLSPCFDYCMISSG
jgi:hypothetical protein